MRLSIRPIAAMLLAVGVATCTEMTAGPRSGSAGKARFALAPSFTPLADEAAASGEAHFDRVRIIITRPSAPTPALLDTTKDFAPGDSDLHLSLDVDATAGELLDAEIQYRTATTVFYDGHTTVTAQVTSPGQPATPTPVTVDYVGPGAKAKTVAVSPSGSSVATTSTQQLTATVRDDSGAPIDSVPIGWTSGDTTIATISAAGLVQPVGPRGSVTFTATTPTGISGTARLTFVPPPSAIKTISGGGQSGVAGTALPQPFVVELDAADGGPVTGATVSFASQQGEVASTTAVTDSLGRAQTTMTLGTAAGTDAFTAGVGTFVTSVSETATPGAAASIVVGASPAQGPAGSQTTLSAQLVDQYGNDVTTEKIPVIWSGGAGGAFAATESETNANGVANNVFVSGLRPDVSYHIEAAAGSAKGSITLSSAPAGPAAAVVFLDPTSFAILPGPLSFTVAAGDDQPNVPIARIVDASGVGVPGAQLTISITLPGGAAGPSATATTDTLGAFPIGEADIPDQTFNAPGNYVISFSSPGVTTPATINVTVLGTVLTKVSGDKQTGSVGQALSAHPTVQLKDANGKVLANHDVSFSPSSGGSVTSPTAQTDASGNASTEWHLSSTLGTQTLTVSSDGATSVTFTATAGVGPATHYTLTVSNTTPTAGSSVTVTAQLRDQFGNAVPLANHTVTWSGGTGGTFASPTSTTASDGTASVVFTTGSTPASYQIHASDGTLGGDISVSTSAAPIGAATSLALMSTPPPTATSGTAAAAPILVQALDANGHPVGGINITAAISGGFSLRGTTTVTTDAATGTASFAALHYVGAGNATVTFSSTGLTPTSFALTLSAAPADSLRLVGDASLSFLAGTLPASIPNVIAVDSTGTPVANAPVIVSVASSGIVFFADTTVTGTDGMLQLIPSTKIPSIPAGAYTVTASSTGLVGSPVLVSVTVTAAIGPATHLSLSATTPATGISGTAAASPIQVQALDANNHAVSGIAISASISSGFSLRGTTTASTDVATGTASFSALRYVGAGHATVTFSASGLTPVSFELDLAAAPADSLRRIGEATLNFVAGTVPTTIPNVIVVDSTGTAVANAPVIVAVSASGVVLFADTTVTGSDGMLQLPPSALTSAIQGIPAGTYTVSATSGTLIGSPVQVTATVTQPTLSLSVVTQPSDAMNAVALSHQPSVKLMDSNGQPLAGATISIAANRISGSGSIALSNNTAVTDASGVATFSQFQMTGVVGQFQLTFSAAVPGRSVSPVPSNTISLVAGAATTLTPATDETIVQQAGLFSTLQTPPSVKIGDVSGNAVSGVTPIWSNQSECLNDGLHLGTPGASSSGGLAVAPTVTLSNSETGTCVLVAKLTAESMSPTDTAAFIYVQRPAGITKVFTGNSKTDASKWSDPDNWSGHQVPAPADDVLINASVAAKAFPTLDVQMTIGSLTFEPGGFMTLDDEDLTVAGSVTTSDSTFSIITGTGHLILTGTNGSTLSAAVFGPGVVVGKLDDCGTTHYTTSTFLLVSDLTLECPLKLADSSYVGAIGNFTTEYGGSIEMHGAASTLSVLSNAVFNGASESTLLTEGDMVFSGDFTQSGTTSSFVATDSANAYFVGDATQHISFTNAGPADGYSRFAHLWLENSTGVIGMTNIAADTLEQFGAFTMNDGQTFTADFAAFGPTSTTYGPGLLNAGSCTRMSGAIFEISLFGGISECSFIGVSRLPARITPLASRSLLRTRTLGPASVSPREQVCAIVRQLNRPVRSSIQAACRQ